MKPARRKLLIGGLLVALLCISPVVGFVFLFKGEDIRLDMTMPRYPGMAQLGYTQGHYGAGSDSKALYFWTEDSINQVQQFYEKFSLPFVRHSGTLVTVFNPYAEVVPLAYNVDVSRFDTSEDRECHYTQRYDCIKVSIRTFSASGRITVPPPSLDSRIIKTAVPSYIPNPVHDGTLIMVEFYMHDF